MPIIEIDKSVVEEIENMIERKDKMYESQIATTKKLTDGIEKVYEQEVKKLRNQLQQKENIIKEVREYIEQCQLGEDNEGRPYMLANQEEGQELLGILDREKK